MLRADALTVVHHDDTTSEFTDVRYTLDRSGLRIVTAGGTERAFSPHDVLTTHVRLAHQCRPRIERRSGERRGADHRGLVVTP